MDELFKWLAGNTFASNIFIISFGIVIISISLTYLVAFFQGREISFWPPKIGAKINSNNQITAKPNEKFRIDRDIQSETAINDIADATQTIHVTHFSGRIPDEKYINTMIDKINNASIDIVRIIPNDLKHREWLESFKRLGNKYSQKEVGSRLDFDMLIVDRKKVSLYFPTHRDAIEFKRVVFFDDKEIAECFMTVFQRLK